MARQVGQPIREFAEAATTIVARLPTVVMNRINRDFIRLSPGFFCILAPPASGVTDFRSAGGDSRPLDRALSPFPRNALAPRETSSFAGQSTHRPAPRPHAPVVVVRVPPANRLVTPPRSRSALRVEAGSGVSRFGKSNRRRRPRQGAKSQRSVATLPGMKPTALEDTLRRIPGIEAVRVVIRGQDLAEVHILAQPGKAAKQVVRDVQSVALAGHGVEIDRRIVSVVQMESADLVAGDRPVIQDVAEEIDGSRMKMTVTLEWHEVRLTGTATGPAASSTRLRLVAEATISALEQALNQEAAFAINAVDNPTVGTREVAIAQVVLVVEQRERLLVGSSIVDADPAKAMVRAVLDAVNRQVPALRR